MSDLVRLSFSIEQPLLTRLERLVVASEYHNRSEYIRDMIRARLVEHEWDANAEALGTITLVYDHRSRQLSDHLMNVQHDHHHIVLATTHVHLDAHLCAEMIMVRGRAAELQQLINQLQKPKGVLHATLSMTSTGKHL